MTAKQNSTMNKKIGEANRKETLSATQQAESVLQSVKQKAGDVIQIAINERTTIELPAHLSQEEIDARVKKYIERNKSKL